MIKSENTRWSASPLAPTSNSASMHASSGGDTSIAMPGALACVDVDAYVLKGVVQPCTEVIDMIVHIAPLKYMVALVTAYQ